MMPPPPDDTRTLIDELLADHGLIYPLFAMSRDGARVPGRAYTYARRALKPVSRDLTRDLPDLHAVMEQLEGGSTLILEQLHRTWRPVASFCRRLSYELSRPVWATSYLTPATARGFGLHYDTHGVFVLQIEGRKTWELYRPIMSFPLDHQRWREDALSAEARRDMKQRGLYARYELVPGDVLWVPRGWLHEVFTTGSASLHISLSIPELSKYQMITHLLETLAQSDEFRLDLPLDAFETPARARTEAEQVLKSFATWVSHVDPADLAGRTLSGLHAKWHPTRSSPVTAALLPDEEIANAAGVVAVREAVLDLEYITGGRLALKTVQGKMILDPPAARFVGELLTADNRDLVPVDRYLAAAGPDARRVMRRLLGEGILELVADCSPEQALHKTRRQVPRESVDEWH